MTKFLDIYPVAFWGLPNWIIQRFSRTEATVILQGGCLLTAEVWRNDWTWCVITWNSWLEKKKNQNKQTYNKYNIKHRKNSNQIWSLAIWKSIGLLSRCSFQNISSGPTDCKTGQPKSLHSHKLAKVHTCILSGSNVYKKVWRPDAFDIGVKHRFTNSHFWTSCSWLDWRLSDLLISRKLRVQIVNKRL